MFFATATGDARMLVHEDSLAVCHARAGKPQPVRIVETDTTAAIEWDRTFQIEGGKFIRGDKGSDRTTTNTRHVRRSGAGLGMHSRLHLR
ncbi:MAG: hypothetical protein ACKV0T_24270 [Planctomycetales bacterium]